MSKQDNLTDFLTDVADAIREKKGTTDLINPQNFSEEIRGIESGGSENVFAEEMIDNTGNGLRTPKKIIITEGVTEIASYYAYQYSSIEEIYLPSTLEKIGRMAFNTMSTLIYVSPFSKSFNYIDVQAFQYCAKLPVLDFSQVQQIPTLAATTSFTATICKFVVPDALYDDWIAATNWTTYASRIVKASEFVEPTT